MFTATCSPERWPTPLAIVYSDMLHAMAGGDTIPHEDLRRFVTQLLQILVCYALLEAGHVQLSEKELADALGDLSRPADGKMNDVVHELSGLIVKGTGAADTSLFFHSMWNWWRSETVHGLPVHAAIRRLVTIRNRQAHETAPAESASSDEQVTLLGGLISSLKWLESYTIFRIDQVRLTQQGPCGALTVFVGDNPRGESRPNAKWQGNIHQEHVWIADLNRHRAISSYPFFWAGKRGSVPQDALFTLRSITEGRIELSQPMQAGLRHNLPEGVAAKKIGLQWLVDALRQNTPVSFAYRESGTEPRDERIAGSADRVAAGENLPSQSHRRPTMALVGMMAALLLGGLSLWGWLSGDSSEGEAEASPFEAEASPSGAEQPMQAVATSPPPAVTSRDASPVCSPTQSWQGGVCVPHASETEAAEASYRWSREQFGTANPAYRYEDIYAPVLDFWFRSASYARDRLPVNFREVTTANGYQIQDLILLYRSSDGYLFFESGYVVRSRGRFFHAKLVLMRHDGSRWRIAGEAAMSQFPEAWRPGLLGGAGRVLRAQCGVFWNTNNPQAGEWTLALGVYDSPLQVQRLVEELDTCFGAETRGNRAGTLHTWRLPTRLELEGLLNDLPPAADALPRSLEGAVPPSEFPADTQFWVEAGGQPVVVTRSTTGALTLVPSDGANARVYAIRVRHEP